jgi:4-carboxymuconolactone decarboxylase
MTTKYQNAVLDDYDLMTGLKSINPVWGDLTVRVAGEVFAMPLIEQKTKMLINIVIDQTALNVTDDGNPFGAHVDMALKQGTSYEEIEKLIVFASAYTYTGFNKGATTMDALNKLRHERGEI